MWVLHTAACRQLIKDLKIKADGSQNKPSKGPKDRRKTKTPKGKGPKGKGPKGDTKKKSPKGKAAKGKKVPKSSQPAAADPAAETESVRPKRKAKAKA